MPAPRTSHSRDKHGRYYPNGQYLCTISIRIDQEMNARIVAAAQAQGVTRAELLRTFTEWGLETLSQ